MATMRAFAREQFSRERSFVVAQAMTLDGKKLKPHDAFDKFTVTTRRLRLMYDRRMIAMEPKIPAAPPPPPEPEKMSDRQLTLMLEDNGILIRPNATRSWLINRTRKLLDATTA